MRRAGSNSVGGAVDDLAASLEAKLDAWAADNASHYGGVAAEQAYAVFRQRFENDKDILVQEIVTSAAPKVHDAVIQILDSTDTQARLGTAQDEFKSALAKALLVTAVGTAGLTWFLLRNRK